MGVARILRFKRVVVYLTDEIESTRLYNCGPTVASLHKSSTRLINDYFGHMSVTIYCCLDI